MFYTPKKKHFDHACVQENHLTRKESGMNKKKIEDSDFITKPFKHIYIENFFSDSDFNQIINSPQINLQKANNPNELIKNLKDNEIDGLIVIGGDGSFTGALKLKQEFNFPVVGIPGTIDNDLHGTSHTLGYDTALNTVMDAIDKIRDTAISHHRLFLVEVMGADAGYIALNSGLAIGAQEILIPEVNMSFENLINSLKKSKKSGKTSSIIVVAEGDKTGKNVFELASKIEETLPKYETRVSVLGHIQRGGTPSCFDRVLGTQLGVKAVESLIEGNDGNMVGIDLSLIHI